MPEIKEHELAVLGHLIEANDGSDYKRLHLSYLDARIDGAGFKDGVITQLTSHQAATEAIKELKGRLDELRHLAALVVHKLDEDEGQGPGHCHRDPGVWDDSGAHCKWCETWSAFKLAAIDRALSLEGGG